MNESRKNELKKEWENLKKELYIDKKFCGKIRLIGSIFFEITSDLECSLAIEDWEFQLNGKHNKSELVTCEFLRAFRKTDSKEEDNLYGEADRLLLRNKKSKKMKKDMDLFLEKVKEEAKKDKVKNLKKYLQVTILSQ